MSEKPLPFVVTDRRKFTPEGESRPDADPSPEREPRPETVAPPTEASGAPSQTASSFEVGSEALPVQDDDADPQMPPAPTAEQMEQSRIAFEATAERLETAVRAANPGVEHPPAMTFDQLIQSVYMQAILQLGGGAPEGQQPQVDILGAKSSIEMLTLLDAKTHGNLSEPEHALLSSALFELRLGFLEITQALARSAQQRAQSAGAQPPPTPGGPRIVR
jgi:hypothetical protein